MGVDNVDEWFRSDNFERKQTGTLIPSRAEKRAMKRITIVPPGFNYGWVGGHGDACSCCSAFFFSR